MLAGTRTIALWALVGAFFAPGFACSAATKQPTAPAHITAAPLVTTINGNPLQIHVGDDLSFQVFNSQVPGSGQIFPTGATDTADMGWFVRAGNVLYAPNFGEHPSGSATGGIGPYTAFTQTALSGVSGSGSAADPFKVTASGSLGPSGLSANLQVLYANGDNYFTKIFTLSNGSGTTASASVFLGADIYLASSDAGVPYLEPNSSSPGGQDCVTVPPSYTILLIPQTPADAYSARGYSTVWSEIGAGQLSNTVDPTCIDNGAGLQWNRTIAAGATTVLQAATSFGAIPSITQFNVSAVAPPSGSPGSTVDVTITGIGFTATTTFSFGAGITIGNLVIVDANTATATLTIASTAAPGPRNVQGTQGGASQLTSTLVNGFTVTGDVPPPSDAAPVPMLDLFGMLALLAALVLIVRHTRRSR